MEEMLQRGFTTIRGLGGADHGLVRGLKEGLIDGPRVVICGKGLTSTAGHADLRKRTDDRPGMMSDRPDLETRIRGERGSYPVVADMALFSAAL